MSPNQQDVSQIPAGRELDALVETQVFGRCHHDMKYVSDEELTSRARRAIMAEWQEEYGKQPPDAFVMSEAQSRVWDETSGDYSTKECTKCGVSAYGTRLTPKYSTDISAAWEVVEKLRELARAQKLWGPKFAIHIPVGDGRWVVELHNDLYGGMSEPHTHDTQWRGIAETAPHAICLAALNAVGAGALPSRETTK